MLVTDKDANKPLDDAELKELFSLIEELAPPVVVIAVSGGPDSMALMAAVSRWHNLVGNGARLIVATVNHGLRPTAQVECDLVTHEANRLGLDCRLLIWQGEKPKTGIQEKAREARYQLLCDLCDAEADETILLTAHTLDDQAETVMMRLARGSGITGLGGMRDMRRFGHRCGWHLRPLLATAKTRLIASCRAWNIPFTEDPSNHCDEFTRVRWRKLIPLLAKEGLDANRIVTFANRLDRAEDALETQTSRARHIYQIKEPEPGIQRINARALHNNEPFEIILRVYGNGIGKRQQVRLNRLEDCVWAFHKAAWASTPLRRTLAGTLISLDKNGILTFSPEPPRKRGRKP